jgi:DNA invertase Pin-like site-specific DNA recombinase
MAVAFDIDAAMKRKINKAKKENGPQSRNHFKTPQDTNNAEPAFSIVKSLGGVRAVARELECSPGTVTRWCRATRQAVTVAFRRPNMTR